MFFKYILFGIIDNGIILLLGLLGVTLEKPIERFINYLIRRKSVKITIKSSGRFGLFVAMLSNAISDWCGGLGVSQVCSWGTFFGCLLMVVILIPLTFKVERR